MGEARYFGKPIFVVPMPNQHEQEINARYARLEGFGDWCSINELTGKRIQACIEKRPTGPRPTNGVDQALALMGISYG
jgi:UDP:flavonoid glycosyltransferase YjiC (YdhE family)